ncbi:hypothetical protein [Massilia psychrophila]|uniref:hypothetical protein n=1 Tax=Massilia psychrophila TaxID=1603353 RepID=UPI00117D3603|nr:hypothetical protein [Massilia psychrophila]
MNSINNFYLRGQEATPAPFILLLPVLSSRRCSNKPGNDTGKPDIVFSRSRAVKKRAKKRRSERSAFCITFFSNPCLSPGPSLLDFGF